MYLHDFLGEIDRSIVPYGLDGGTGSFLDEGDEVDTLDQSVAVIGLGCVVPDALSVPVFWENALRAHCALRPLSSARYPWATYHDPLGTTPDLTSTITAGAVEGWSLNWRKYRIPPADVASINPLSLMTVDAGAQALDAVKRLPASRTGVFLGATGFGWQRDAGQRIRMDAMMEAIAGSLGGMPAAQREGIERDLRARLDGRLGPVNEDTVVNGPASVAAGRLAMLYDLRGIHYALDAGYASGLASLEAGVRALRDGTLDAALVGGASELLTPLELVAFSRLGGLSRGLLRPFDAAADGTLLGEGVAMLALKRLGDALRDGEHIHAVIRGVGGACDGRARSLVAPSPEGQARAMRRAYQDAGVDPTTVAYVECHATGTTVGDRSELTALREVLGAGSGVLVGSVKAALGHLRGGAGAVGLLRAVLAAEHKIAPKQVGFERPSDTLAESGFAVPTTNIALEPRPGARVVRTASSAFGFGGIGYHAVLEAFDPREHRAEDVKVYGGIERAEPIAIVGMGGMFPGADDVPTFWRNLLEGRDATGEVPKERWDLDRYFDADPGRADKSYTRLGCFLEKLPEANPRWKIPPASLETLDPSHLLCLRSAEEALADAGMDLDTAAIRDRAAVMLAFLPYQGRKFLADVRVGFHEVITDLRTKLTAEGIAPAEIDSLCAEAERRFKEGLPPVTEDSLTGWLGSLNAARISRLLDLHGPCFVVDAACASTHAAMHAAVTALRHRTADVALTGGVWTDMQPEFFVGACRFNALSATGSTPFDKAADGFIPGEGGGVLVLRRLDDAIRDGQRVHAVIRSIAGSSDGKGRSVLAPTVHGEAAAMQLALDQAKLRGADVGYVECHGTGTALGDVVEATAVGQVFGGSRAEPVRIGSVKSNIGHLNAAAGVPGMIKSVLALREGVIPASLKVTEPNPAIDFKGGNVEVVRERAVWERPASGPRRAGVSSFGVGGANMHVILEEHVAAKAPRAQGGTSHRSTQTPMSGMPVTPRPGGGGSLLPIAKVAADSPQGCLQNLRDLSDKFAREGASALAEPAGRGAWRAAVVAPSAEELSRRVTLLRGALERGADLGFLRQQGIFMARPWAAAVAMFPGQGPHYANMGRALAAALPEFDATLAEVDDAYRSLSGRTLRSSFWTDDPDRWVQVDEDIHCAVFAINVAIYRVLERRGLAPVALVGQSAGELSALTAAGALSLADGLRAVYERTRSVLMMPTKDPGVMVSIREGVSVVRKLIDGLPGYAAIAAENGPTASIVSANALALDPLRDRLRSAGVDFNELAVSHGYHSQLIADAMPRYRKVLEDLRFSTPRIPIISTITGDPISALAHGRMPEHLTRQFIEPVRLSQATRAAWDAGGRVFIECGPKWSLATFTQAILEGREHWTQATLHPKIGEEEQLARALACMAVHGHDASWPQTTSHRPPPSSRRFAPPSSRPSIPPPGDLAASVARLGTSLEQTSGPSRERLLETLRTIRGLIDEVLGDASESPRSARSIPPARLSSPASSRPPARRNPTMPPAALFQARASIPAPPPAVASKGLEQRLIAAFAARTGYPEEMLDTALDLEADLGIDTVKQVAVLAEIRTELGLEVDPAFVLRDHPTLASLARHFSDRLAAIDTAARAPLSARPAPRSSRPPARVDTPPPADVRARLVAAFAERTGYPEEMLEPGLDLEADLGIDTVKQIAVLASVREALGLEIDRGFTLRDHPTIGELADYLTARMGTGRKDPLPSEATPAPEVPRAAAPPSVMASLRQLFAERTGYPAEMLEPDLDLEADLGIDTVKQAAVLSVLRQSLSLSPDATFVPREHRTLAQLEAYFLRRLSTSSVATAPASSRPNVPPPSTPLPRRAASSEDPFALVLESTRATTRFAARSLRIHHPQAGADHLAVDRVGGDLRVTSSQGTILELSLASPTDHDRVLMPPELLGSFALSHANAGAIARALGSPAPTGVEWAHAPRFDRVMGTMTLSGGSLAARGASLIEVALWYVALLGARTLGATHDVVAVEALQLEAIPEASTQVRIVGSSAPRSHGRACADVGLYGVDGRPVASLRGVASVAGPPIGEETWRRLVLRLEDHASTDEDGASW